MSLQCRICLEDDTQNNLVTPCNCNGTSKYVHPECLTKWRIQNIDTPYYNTCIDCRKEYEYTIESKEKMFISNNNTLIIQIGLIALICLLTTSFDDNTLLNFFDSIKNKNLTTIFAYSNYNYYYIFFHIIISNYILNCLFLLLSYILLFKVINLKKYLFKIYYFKIYNVIKLSYIFIFYVIFSVKMFLALSFLLIFIDCAIMHSYIEKHNQVLNNLNINNINYKNDLSEIEQTTSINSINNIDGLNDPLLTV